MAYQDVLKKTQDNVPVVNQIQGQKAPTPVAPTQATQIFKSINGQTFSSQAAADAANIRIANLRQSKTPTLAPVVTPVEQPKITIPNTPTSIISPAAPAVPITPIGELAKLTPSNYKYGAEISALGTQAQPEIEKRNTDLASYYSKQGKTDKTSILEDLSKNPSFMAASDSDKQNTVQAIVDKISATAVTPQQQIQEDEFARATKELGIIDETMANTLKTTLQGTINQQALTQKEKDKYSNYDDIAGINQSVLREFSTLRKAVLETGDIKNAGGPVTEDDIQQIATKTGLNPDDVKAALNGTIRQKLTPTGAEGTTLAHDQFVADETKANQRALEDMDTQLRITTTNINQQIDDVANEMTKTLQSQAVAAGLSGSIQSAGVTAGLTSLKNDYQKTIDRLQQKRTELEAADIKMRGRLLEDYNQEMSRAKSKYETDMSNVKLNAGIGLTEITNNNSLGSDTFTQALAEFKKNVDLSRQSVFTAYTSNIKGATDLLYYNTEKQLGVEKMKADVQQQQQANLFVDNGAALYNMSTTSLQQQVKDGTISQATYTNAVGYMTSLATSTLSQMGTPTSEDIANVEAAIKNGKTPQAAIAAITSANPSRFQNLTIEQAKANLAKTQSELPQTTVETPYTQQDLGETPVDTGIKNVYGTNVKLAPTVGAKLQTAVDTLKTEGIELGIGDSTRSHAVQQAAYDKWVAGGKVGPQVAEPGLSFHEKGQAIDISQSQMNDTKVEKALLDAGFTRPVASEKFHRSIGEGSDKFTKPEVDYKEYGKLTETDFNPNNPTDLDAKRYIDIYLKSGKFPTATQLYGSARAKETVNFKNVVNRADELYYDAAGTSMPDTMMLTSNKKLIQDNNKTLNKQEILGSTIVKNFDLAIKGEIKNNVNKNATAINKILNPIYLALGDPAVNQAMVSNGTISQEFANLISIRNNGGTLAADKEMADELIKFGTSVEAQKAVVERLKAEAANIHDALKDQNAKLWLEVDPFELDNDNPNRINKIKGEIPQTDTTAGRRNKSKK